MSGLAELVEELALGRVEWIGERRKYTPALLQQLREAVFGDVGGTSRGASSGSPIPINAGAFTLWEDIAGQIDAAFNGVTDLRPASMPIPNLLGWWAAFSAATFRTDSLHTDEVTLLAREVAYERLEGWAARIRAHFAPPRTKEVMVACPNCGMERIVIGSGVMAEEVFALAATVVDGEVTVQCRNPLCVDTFGDPSEWKGEHQLAELGRRTGHAIMPTELRDALAPQSLTEWSDAPSRTIEDLDLSKPEHAALLSQGGEVA
jgi:hypothetical protein